MNIDYANLERDIVEGTLAQRLEEELTRGFREMHERGEPLPPPSYYASRIAEIIYAAAERPLDQEASFNLYQEVLLACEKARAGVLGEELPQ
jgi:hypothetical protein